MDEITTLLSEKRLAKYKGISKEDAFKCHLYNSELAESFYQSLSYFEIILRNKVDLVFSKYLGQDWVFKTEYHIGKNQHHYEETVKRIEREKGSEYLTNRDCIISELMFGYWSFLFSSAYKEILWNKYPEMFGKIFDNSKYTLTLFKAYSQINKIRLYRNKVFHYGSLLTTTEDMMKPEQIHNMIYSMCRSMSAGKLIKYVRAIDSFDEKYQKGKTLGILK
jgi:hypothetical protein